MSKKPITRLSRQLGLMALTATGVCSMLGASINVVPFMIQRHVPGIGPYVLPAFIFAALPALLAALAYGILGSAMPRAGGSYVYASRGLNPYLGFMASFSQWFGLSIIIGVIAYLIVPFLRDVTLQLGWQGISAAMDIAWVRVAIALVLVWSFVWINIRGIKSYKSVLLPMMYLMFALGGIVIVAGFIYSSDDFLTAVQKREGRIFHPVEAIDFNWRVFLSAAAILFSSFIGFDSIAQAGGEARDPRRNLPRAILLAISVVGLFYFLFAASVYHIVPWSFVAEASLNRDITAPGLLSYVLPAHLGIAILLGAVIALINDLPAMILSVSRLMFAWSEDGVFAALVARIHPTRHTPHIALIIAGLMASIGVLGSHFAGDFFLGIDIMVTSMMFNFLLMCITLLLVPKINPGLAASISVIKSRNWQLLIGILGALLLIVFLVVHTYNDLTSHVSAWYFHATLIWLIVMAFASGLFFFKWHQLKSKGIDVAQRFKNLPIE
jgi:amino acid transporter